MPLDPGRPEVAILGADQKERGLWGREFFVVLLAGFTTSVRSGIFDNLTRLYHDKADGALHCYPWGQQNDT